jgi:hypothetical protein
MPARQRLKRELTDRHVVTDPRAKGKWNQKCSEAWGQSMKAKQWAIEDMRTDRMRAAVVSIEYLILMMPIIPEVILPISTIENIAHYDHWDYIGEL